jgi:hypothetical protein
MMDYRQAIEPAIVVLAVAGAQPWRRLQPNRWFQWIGAERAPKPEIAAISPTT